MAVETVTGVFATLTIVSLLVFIIGLGIFFVACCTCWPFFVAVFLGKTFADLIGSGRPTYQVAQQRRYQQNYQILNTGDTTYPRSNDDLTPLNSTTAPPSAPPIYHSEDAVVAEAYLVAPLMACSMHNENPNVVLAHGVPVSGNGTALQSSSSTGLGNTTTSFHITSAEENARAAQSEDRNKSPFKDVWAAILFVINVMVVCTGAILTLSNNDLSSIASAGAKTETASSSSSVAGGSVLGLLSLSLLLMAVVATMMGSIWLSILLQYSEYLIIGVMWVNIIVPGVMGVLLLLKGVFWGAVLLLFMSGLGYWYLNSVRNRIPFASAVLSTASKSIGDHYSGLVFMCVGLVVTQIAWFVVWSIAGFGTWQAIGAYTSEHSHTYTSYNENGEKVTTVETTGSNPYIFCYILLTFSMYWASNVIFNVAQATVAGTVASWWFQPARPSTVRGALFRATTTSFGSICYGSLLVAIVQTLRDLANSARNQLARENRNRNVCSQIVLCLIEWILSSLEMALQYFNRYAFVYVAAWGTDFMTSGKKVYDLFVKRGWTAIINDNLISNALALSTIVLGVMTSICGAIISIFMQDSFRMAGIDHPTTLLAVLGGFMGICVGALLVNALHAAVATVFVCMAESPDALQNTHPEEYEKLLSTWIAIYPDLIRWYTNAQPYAQPYTSHVHHVESGMGGGYAGADGGGAGKSIAYGIPVQAHAVM